MTKPMLPPHMTQTDIEALLAARHGDPFGVLGLHETDGVAWCVALLPDADTLDAVIDDTQIPLPRLTGPIFAGKLPKGTIAYSLRATFADGRVWDFHDPYRFGPVLKDVDQYLIGEGSHRKLWHALGAHVTEMNAFCRLGTQCGACICGGRFQHLGWPPPPNAACGRHGCLGNLFARSGRRHLV